MSRFIALVLTFIYVGSAHALNYDSSSAELGVGATDNVYQDDLNKKSDTYANLGYNLRFTDSREKNLSFRVFAQGYGKEKTNNYLSYIARYKTKWLKDRHQLNLFLGGLQYNTSESGATDESYNNIYFGGYSSSSIYNENSFELFFEPGAKLTSFPRLSNRRDAQIYGRLHADWVLQGQHSLMPLFELGLLFSSQGYFTRQYVDIGISYEYELMTDLTFTSEFYIRSSTYPNRKISDILLTERRNGRVTSVEVEALERTQQTDLNAGLTQTFDRLSLTGLIQRSQLTSRSRLEYYTENLVQFSLQYIF